MDDFDDKYYDKMREMLDRFIELAEDAYRPDVDSISNFDPRKIPPRYDKALQYREKIKAFCESKGSGGVLYYQKELLPEIEEAQDNYDNYMETEYETALADYLQELVDIAEEKKRKKEVEKKLKKLFLATPQIMQKDLMKEFTEDEKSHAKEIASDWISKNKIEKSKNEKGFIVLTYIVEAKS